MRESKSDATKIVAMLSIIILAVALIISLLLFSNKISDYKDGLKGDGKIQGTYELVQTPADTLYMSINVDTKEYYFCKNSSDTISKGRIVKQKTADTNLKNGSVYKLYEGKSKDVYGVVTLSYNQISFVDKEMNSYRFEKNQDAVLSK